MVSNRSDFVLISITNFQLVSTFFLVFPTGFQQFPMFSDWFLMVSNDFQLVSVVSSGLPQSPMVLRPDVGYQCWVSQSNRPRAALGTHAQPNHLTFKVQLCVWPSVCGVGEYMRRRAVVRICASSFGFQGSLWATQGPVWVHLASFRHQFGVVFFVVLTTLFCSFFWVIFGCFYRYLWFLVAGRRQIHSSCPLQVRNLHGPSTRPTLLLTYLQESVHVIFFDVVIFFRKKLISFSFSSKCARKIWDTRCPAKRCGSIVSTLYDSCGIIE